MSTLHWPLKIIGGPHFIQRCYVTIGFPRALVIGDIVPSAHLCPTQSPDFQVFSASSKDDITIHFTSSFIQNLSIDHQLANWTHHEHNVVPLKGLCLWRHLSIRAARYLNGKKSRLIPNVGYCDLVCCTKKNMDLSLMVPPLCHMAIRDWHVLAASSSMSSRVLCRHRHYRASSPLAT